jgi:hypothetical protein
MIDVNAPKLYGGVEEFSWLDNSVDRACFSAFQKVQFKDEDVSSK